MKQSQTSSSERRVLTIPNLLSALRIVMLPVIVWLYCGKQDYGMAAAILVLSGLTDIADGYIARTFHMVSNVGKILDPIADKLTQFTVLVCLCTRFPAMLVPCVLMVIKESVMGITGLRVIRKTGNVYGAVWHGKLTTCLLYCMMFLHILWYGIPAAVSNLLIIVCVAVMLLSLVLYVLRNLRLMREAAAPEQ